MDEVSRMMKIAIYQARENEYVVRMLRRFRDSPMAKRMSKLERAYAVFNLDPVVRRNYHR